MSPKYQTFLGDNPKLNNRNDTHTIEDFLDKKTLPTSCELDHTPLIVRGCKSGLKSSSVRQPALTS